MSSSPITTEDTSSFGSRARAYSDAHALVYSNNNRNSPPNINVAMGDTNNTSIQHNSTAHHSPTNKMSCSKKRHSYEHHHHHHGNRPRSKSLDLHRGAASVHKKKYPHHTRVHSPGGHLIHGRKSPTAATQGKCWVRKAASPVPLFPSALCLTGAASRSPTSPSKEHYHQQQQQYVDNITMNNVSSSPVPQVTNESTLRSPTSMDDEMMLMHDTDDLSHIMYTSPNSSFDYDHHQGPQEQQGQQGPYQGIIKPVGKRSIIFGESGKPIKPRSAFEQYTSSSATATVL